MDIIEELVNKDIKVGDTVSICSYDYVKENNPNDLYIGRCMEWGTKNVKITKITVEGKDNKHTWYTVEGIYFCYQKEWLIRSK